jgi:hypothetical protein
MRYVYTYAYNSSYCIISKELDEAQLTAKEEYPNCTNFLKQNRFMFGPIKENSICDRQTMIETKEEKKTFNGKKKMICTSTYVM